MAFSRYMNAASVAFEYYPMKAGVTPAMGKALKLVNGNLELCGATDVPVFVCCSDKANSNGLVAVERVQPDIAYVVKPAVAVSGLTVGSSYTLTAGSDDITTTTTSGVFKVNKKIDNKVVGYFR